MSNNDKKGNTHFWKNKLGQCKQGMQEIGNNHANKLDMLFQLFRAIGGPNHTIMEYSLLNRCNHKIRCDGPMAYRLAWHTRPNSRSQIIPWGHDGIHWEFLWTKTDETNQIWLLLVWFLRYFWSDDLSQSRKSDPDVGNKHPLANALPFLSSRSLDNSSSEGS